MAKGASCRSFTTGRREPEEDMAKMVFFWNSEKLLCKDFSKNLQKKSNPKIRPWTTNLCSYRKTFQQKHTPPELQRLFSNDSRCALPQESSSRLWKSPETTRGTRLTDGKTKVFTSKNRFFNQKTWKTKVFTSKNLFFKYQKTGCLMVLGG